MQFYAEQFIAIAILMTYVIFALLLLVKLWRDDQKPRPGGKGDKTMGFWD